MFSLYVKQLAESPAAYNSYSTDDKKGRDFLCLLLCRVNIIHNVYCTHNKLEKDEEKVNKCFFFLFF